MENNTQFDYKKYINTNPKEFIDETLKWLGSRQAQKRFSKTPDIVMITKNGQYNYEGSKIMHDLITEFNLNTELFTKTEKHLSYNNGRKDNAEAIWTIDVEAGKVIVRLQTEIYSLTRYAGKVVEVEIQKEIIEIDNSSYKLLETRNANSIKTSIVDKNNNKLDIDSLPIELKKKIQENYDEDKEWPLDFEPFVYMSNNEERTSDSAYITSELEELVSLKQKKREDIFLTSVKVIEVGQGSASKLKGKKNNVEKANENLINYSATSIQIRDNTSLEGSPSATVVNNVPNTTAYDNSIRTVLNTILKKTGGATDVDAKGTVQQSKSEILMTQGDEFKVAKWKLNDRQNKIKELFTKIWKVYTGILKITKQFKEVESVHVIISQEEVLSETELLANLTTAKEQGFTSDLLAYARYNQLTIVDAYKLKKVNWGNE